LFPILLLAPGSCRQCTDQGGRAAKRLAEAEPRHERKEK
jgi:hypothetical protein